MSWQPPSTTCPNASLTDSYSYITPIPSAIQDNLGVECILGVDEAGRGPVLGPMVYGISYCSVHYADNIAGHGFMDSKVLHHDTRVSLLERMCNVKDELFREFGWSVRVMSARDIGAGMLRPTAPYNLNAQAHDTTIQLIRDVLNQGVNVRKIFVDTVGVPETYQLKLQREFPMAQVTVSKKADSIYPIVSVASICAKVTRDKALLLAAPSVPILDEQDGKDDSEAECKDEDKENTIESDNNGTKKRRKNEFDSDVSDTDEVIDPVSSKKSRIDQDVSSSSSWGSGYPSDARTQLWLKQNVDPIFGWPGSVVRYSWSTVKDMLEGTGKASNQKGSIKVDWFEAQDGDDDDAGIESGQQMLSFHSVSSTTKSLEQFSVENFFGKNIGVKGFAR